MTCSVSSKVRETPPDLLGVIGVLSLQKWIALQFVARGEGGSERNELSNRDQENAYASWVSNCLLISSLLGLMNGPEPSTDLRGRCGVSSNNSHGSRVHTG